ncbi:type II secretion system protein M [Desulfobacula phenolica]|uniref:General secretion pathway protein M n=1 Tax=Desulfobacula phenolica TaxID=90732 RepID=A0A1H2DNX3_9BACT|nr:type II secretion system protein M [Desulfobacula phenolica]SDT84602.1 general secretion pathway protein M [Desulfobacula phenolica]
MALRMNRRERYSVFFACILILAVIVYQFGIAPFTEKKKLFERQLASKKTALVQINRLKSEYESFLNKNNNLKKINSQREKAFTLFAFLEKLAVKAGLDGNIDYMKPSSSLDKASKIELSLVEMKLKSIKLSQLAAYLYLVETSQNIVFVKRLAISRDGRDEGYISAVLHVETIRS